MYGLCIKKFVYPPHIMLSFLVRVKKRMIDDDTTIPVGWNWNSSGYLVPGTGTKPEIPYQGSCGLSATHYVNVFAGYK